MHQDELIFTAKESIWNKEWLDKITGTKKEEWVWAEDKKEPKEEVWEVYEPEHKAVAWTTKGTSVAYGKSASASGAASYAEGFDWALDDGSVKTSYTISEEKLDEAVDNIAVLLRAAADAKIDPAELKDIIREGLEAAIKGSV